MKRNYWKLVVLFGLLALFSCKKDDETKVESKVEYEILDTTTYSPEEYVNAILGASKGAVNSLDLNADTAELFRDAFLQANTELEQEKANKEGAGENGFTLEYTIVTYTYPSINAAGQKVTLQGIFTIPTYWLFGTRYTDPDNLVLDCHWTKASNSEVIDAVNPDKWDWKETLIGMGFSAPSLLLSCRDIMVVHPFYCGYGSSKKEVHPYLSERVMAQNNYDAIVTALQILKDTYDSNLEDDAYSAIIGYSQGGAVAMATAMYFRELGDKNTEKWDVQRLVCGSGPYNPVVTMTTYFEDDLLDMPFVLPMTLESMFATYPEEMAYSADPNVTHTFEDYFCDTIKKSDIRSYVVSKDHDGTAISRHIASMVYGDANHKVYCSDFLSKEAMDSTSEIYQNLMACLEKNNLTNSTYWPHVPAAKTKIKLHYTTVDEVVPYENSIQMISYLKEQGRTDTKKSVSSSDNHSDLGKDFYLHLLATSIDNWCNE